MTRVFVAFLVLVLFLKNVSAGSLTRRCGRGESAVRGCAVGFRVGHGEGHWAGHWGRWRQQEGAWHFALAAPVWLQTTQIGSGGRHATTRRHGMETGRGSKGRVQIKHGEGGEGSDGGRRWETPTEEMRNADNICHGRVKINRHHKKWLDVGSGAGREVPQRWCCVKKVWRGEA